jgi:hypothetical protein
MVFIIHPHATSTILHPSTPLSNLFSSTLTLSYSLNVGDQFLQPYTPMG